jgi:ferrous iron transport protein B
LRERLLLDTGGYLEDADPPLVDNGIRGDIRLARQRLADAGYPVPAVEAMARYDWIERVLDGVATRPPQQRITFSDRIDLVLMHKVWGMLIFAVLMALVFQSIFVWAAPLMDALDAVVAWLGDGVTAVMPAGALRSLLVDGVIAGAGGVLVFLPQILILFFFIGILEDCGYMARAAYLMDKLMSRIGLSGKSFIPLLSSFACAVPGIMATRVIEDRRDRLVTILLAPLMSCSARLPVYTLLIAAFIPDRRYLGGWVHLQGATMFAMYLIGIVTAIGMALLLKRTILRGETPSFVMELPGYRLPSPRTVLGRMLESGWSFLHTAGTLIVVVAIIVWAAAYFPRSPQVEQEVRRRYARQTRALDAAAAQLPDRAGTGGADSHPPPAAERQRQQAEVERAIANEVAAVHLEQSLLGRAGKLIAPIVRPLGWDWKIGCAVIASFPAREVVISTLGVIYHLGAEQNETSASLRQRLRAARDPRTGRPVFNVPVALSIMVFFALCAQCAATLAVIRRETRSWRWPAFTLAYMTTLAYLGALVTYQVGMLLVR